MKLFMLVTKVGLAWQLHCCHLCTAGSTLFYLIRMEPFTRLCRQLQGGRFDHADRLFHSVAATWHNCLHNSSDTKELTPEWFSQPEFLLNSNKFRLGLRQVGGWVVGW